ncbi:hypothetical protein HOLleu_44890 [Holothuria leucospilota]|uniref:Uncharacterized protein n=1 Tax=Holothuria leucospilota TaxID=206669 RepID=A0A9Q1B9Z2_HOLLE|nr:hypothetical protein HOLleu_44890 [Holothuria leucospilota]
MTVCKKEADTLKKDCIDRTCDNFGVSKLKEHLTTHLSDQVETQIQWKSWEMVDKENGKRMALEVKSGRLGEMIDVLATKLEPFSKHFANSK